MKVFFVTINNVHPVFLWLPDKSPLLWASCWKCKLSLCRGWTVTGLLTNVKQFFSFFWFRARRSGFFSAFKMGCLCMFKLRDWSAIFGTRRQQNESFSEVSEGCGAILETSVNIWLQSGLIRHSRDQTGVTVAKPELTRNKTTPLRWPCAAALFSRNFISNCWGDGAAARCRDGAAAGVWGEETMLEGAHSLIRGVGRAGSQIGVEIGELPYLNKVIFFWLITWWSCLTTTLDVRSPSLKTSCLSSSWLSHLHPSPLPLSSSSPVWRPLLSPHWSDPLPWLARLL